MRQIDPPLTEETTAVKKQLAMFAVVLAGPFSGGAPLASTAESSIGHR
jgi:hypothetical protein